MNSSLFKSPCMFNCSIFLQFLTKVYTISFVFIISSQPNIFNDVKFLKAWWVTPIYFKSENVSSSSFGKLARAATPSLVITPIDTTFSYLTVSKNAYNLFFFFMTKANSQFNFWIDIKNWFKYLHLIDKDWSCKQLSAMHFKVASVVLTSDKFRVFNPVKSEKTFETSKCKFDRSKYSKVLS